MCKRWCQMNGIDDLTETEQLLLMAAAVRALGPQTDLMYANTARVVNQVLRWRGLSDDEIRDGWPEHDRHPQHDQVYTALVRMVRVAQRGGKWRRPERPGIALFEGSGNWGVPGDPDQPPAWPHYNSCRLTAKGERLAQALLERHPEYRKGSS